MKEKNRIRIMKIKSTLPQKAMRILLIVTAVFLLLKGVQGLLKNNDAQAADVLISNYFKASEYKRNTELQAAALAEAFALELFSYDGDDERYSESLSKYATAHLNFDWKGARNLKSEGIYAQPLMLAWTQDNQLNVDVKVKVRYMKSTGSEAGNNSTEGENAAQQMVQMKDMYLRIPVVEDQGRITVIDHPVFIPPYEKGNPKASAIEGKAVDGEIADKIAEDMENFFKTFLSGKSGEISYYMLDTKNPVKGLEGKFSLDKVTSCNVYQVDDGFLAAISLEVKDIENYYAFTQNYYVKVVKKEDRYYVKDFDVRLKN